MGMLVEIREVGTSDIYHALADCTDADDKDMKALIIEERFKSAKSPEELYHLVPTVEPTVGQCLRKAVQSDFWKGPHYPYVDFGVFKLQNTDILKKSNALELEGCRAFLPG
ncbi:MAG: hypothetical protein ACKPKO_60955, partial [Candidatus Fonsibacter sp.]